MASNNELTLTIKANSATAEAALNKIIDRVGVLADRADKSTSIASSGFSKLSVVAVAVGNIIANVVSGAWGKMTAQIDSAIKRFDTMNNFPKVMANLGIAADKSQVAIQKISDKLKGLPTALDTATMGVQRLVAKNGDLDKSVDLFLALNNAVLAGGAPTELQTAAIEQLTQAYARGKPDMMEWRSIMTAMPAQLTQVAKAMGFVNAEALGEALRNGEVSMDSFMDTVNRLNKEGVAGFSNFEQQARAATGGIQTGIANMETAITRGWTKILDAIGSDTINQILADLGNQFEGLLNGAANFINFLQENSGVLTFLITVIGSITAGIIAYNLAMQSAATITGIVNTATLLYSAYQGALAAGLTRTAAAQAALNIAFSVNPIGLVIAAVVAFVAAIAILWTQVEGFRNFFINSWNAIVNFASAVPGEIIKFFNSIPDKVKSVVEKIIGFFSGIGKKIGDFIADGFKSIINGALGLVEGFLNSPIKLINGALDLINKIPGVNISKITEIKLPRMAEGGILGGNSYSGDKQLFAGNTGEMIINRRDQSALWNAIKSGQFGSDSSTTVNFADGAIIVNAAPNQKPADIAVEVVQAIQTAFISQGVPVDLKRAGELRA